jgi:hypothetical protein
MATVLFHRLLQLEPFWGVLLDTVCNDAKEGDAAFQHEEPIQGTCKSDTMLEGVKIAPVVIALITMMAGQWGRSRISLKALYLYIHDLGIRQLSRHPALTHQLLNTNLLWSKCLQLKCPTLTTGSPPEDLTSNGRQAYVQAPDTHENLLFLRKPARTHAC